MEGIKAAFHSKEEILVTASFGAETVQADTIIAVYVT